MSAVLIEAGASEVNDMIDATDKVKTGLRSFSKYVPDKVVKQLISQGAQPTPTVVNLLKKASISI